MPTGRNSNTGLLLNISTTCHFKFAKTEATQNLMKPHDRLLSDPVMKFAQKNQPNLPRNPPTMESLLLHKRDFLATLEERSTSSGVREIV